ncbi:hypothetical protein [Methanobacterium aggregans]|uniref:hypothetical protein n=1 Tax=Methanobacterium aggregans TaxID=1615586 RepID=UPI001AE78AB7|nr:hypothetical protein [Methanobacterium aggregans]MBP2046215.1 hypothetical protein [Methanobacterium aggregans]
MKISTSTVIGVLFIICSLLTYFANFSTLTGIISASVAIFFILSGFFEIKDYENRTIYLVVVAVIVASSIILAYTQISSIYVGNELIDSLCVGLILAILLWAAYDFIRTWKLFERKLSYLRVLCIVLLLGVMIFLELPGTSVNTSSPMNQTNAGSFENQWISFDYPSNLTVEDASTSDQVEIYIYNGSEQIGGISSGNGTIDDFLYSTGFNKTKVAGRDAVIGNITTSENGTSSGTLVSISLTNSTTLDINFEANNEATFNQLIKTLSIKKTGS